MFAQSIFDIISLFLIIFISFISCSNKVKEKSEINSNRKLVNNQKKQVRQAKKLEENRKVEEIGKNPQDIAVSKDNNENNLGKEANKKKVESIKMKKENVPNDEQNGGKTKTEEQKNDMYFYLDASKLPKLDSTICENIYTPAVHDRANKIAHDHLIIDPKYSEYRGNIDMLSNELKQNKLDQFEKDLENNNKSEATVEASKKAKEIRVKVREDKCVVFETNEIPTDDEEDEGQAQE